MGLLRPVQSTGLSPLLPLVRYGSQSAPLYRTSPHLRHCQCGAAYLLGNGNVSQSSAFTVRVTEQQEAGAHLLPKAAPTGAGNHL